MNSWSRHVQLGMMKGHSQGHHVATQAVIDDSQAGVEVSEGGRASVGSPWGDAMLGCLRDNEPAR